MISNFSSIKQRFESYEEPVISYSSVSKSNIPYIKSLVEAYNSKFNTGFYMDEKYKEILMPKSLKEHSFKHYNNLVTLIERNGNQVSLTESVATVNSNYGMLIETDINQAEIALAATGITEDLQKMIEKLSILLADRIADYEDQMKAVFGLEYAAHWGGIVRTSLEEIIKTITDGKNKIFNANLDLEHKVDGGEDSPMNDMSMNSGVDADDAALGGDVDGLGGDEEEDFLGGVDASSGDLEEPLGRTRKESVQHKKAPLRESKKNKYRVHYGLNGNQCRDEVVAESIADAKRICKENKENILITKVEVIENVADAETIANALKDKKPGANKNVDRNVQELDRALKRDPSLAKAVTDLMKEAIQTVKEDIHMGVAKNLALKNSATMYRIPLKKLTESWDAQCAGKK